MQRRLWLVGASVVAFALVLLLGRLAAAPTYSLLYAGLDPASAGTLVENLDQKGIAYEVRGGNIYVDSAERDRLRLTLAGEGLPDKGGAGYELLDQLTGFGTTAQMFDAAYWRAKEGELARTIVASPAVQKARVHLSNQVTSPFQSTGSMSASVAITPLGGSIEMDQAEAIRHLIAAAVSGLDADDVSVIDSRTGLIAADQTQARVAPSDQLKSRVERMLEARVGPGNAFVELSIERVTETETIVERHVDPESRVLVQSESEESSSRSQNQASDVTVASNIPDGDAAQDDQSEAQNNQTRESASYEVSETQREILREAGAIKRLSVAVLVNAVPQVDGSTQPRSEEELQVLYDLVAAAVGLDTTRGDSLTLKSLAFEPVMLSGSIAETSWIQFGPIDTMRLIQMTLLALVVLAIFVFVLRPILLGRAEDERDGLPLPEMGLAIDGPATALDPPLDPVDRLRSLVNDRQSDSVEILKSWLEDRRRG